MKQRSEKIIRIFNWKTIQNGAWGCPWGSPGGPWRVPGALPGPPGTDPDAFWRSAKNLSKHEVPRDVKIVNFGTRPGPENPPKIDPWPKKGCQEAMFYRFFTCTSIFQLSGSIFSQFLMKIWTKNNSGRFQTRHDTQTRKNIDTTWHDTFKIQCDTTRHGNPGMGETRNTTQHEHRQIWSSTRAQHRWYTEKPLAQHRQGTGRAQAEHRQSKGRSEATQEHSTGDIQKNP